MSKHILRVGWNHPKAGREGLCAELFTSFTSHLTQLQKAGKIDNWEPIFTRPHGGQVNGMFLIRGDYQKLSAVKDTDEFNKLVTHAVINIEGFSVVEGWTGEGVMEQMARWTSAIPRS